MGLSCPPTVVKCPTTASQFWLRSCSQSVCRAPHANCPKIRSCSDRSSGLSIKKKKHNHHHHLRTILAQAILAQVATSDQVCSDTVSCSVTEGLCVCFLKCLMVMDWGMVGRRWLVVLFVFSCAPSWFWRLSLEVLVVCFPYWDSFCSEMQRRRCSSTFLINFVGLEL